MSSTFVRSHEKLNQTFSETRSCFSHEEPKNMPGLSKSGPFNRKYVKHYYFILVLELSKTIGLNPRGYPGSLLNDFRDSEVVHEYEIFEKAMDTDENGIIGKSEFIGFKDYSKTSDELFNNGHEDTWLLTLKSPQGVLACDKLLGSIGHENYFSTNIGKNFMWDLSTYLPDERAFVKDENNSFFNLATFTALMYEFILYDTNKDGLLTFDSGLKENSSSTSLQLCSDYTWFNQEGRNADAKEFMIHKLRKLVDMLKKQ